MGRASGCECLLPGPQQLRSIREKHSMAGSVPRWMSSLSSLSYLWIELYTLGGGGWGPSCPCLHTMSHVSQPASTRTPTAETRMARDWCWLSIQVSSRVQIREIRGGFCTNFIRGGFRTRSHAEAPDSGATSESAEYYASDWLFRFGHGEPVFASAVVTSLSIALAMIHHELRLLLRSMIYDLILKTRKRLWYSWVKTNDGDPACYIYTYYSSEFFDYLIYVSLSGIRGVIYVSILRFPFWM